MPLGYNAAEVKRQSVTITSGATLSAGANLVGKRMFGFFTPAAYAGGAVTLYSSVDGVTFDQKVYDQFGVAVSITPVAGAYTYLDPAICAGFNFMALKSTTAVGADRVFILNTREV